MNMKLIMCSLTMIIGFSPSCSGMEGILLPHDNVQEQSAVLSKCQTYMARYTLHALYLSTLLTAIIGGYFLGAYVKTEVESMKENCSSMQSNCNDCTDAVAAIKPYLMMLANFTQGCPTAMNEFQTAAYFTMLNCRDENKCKSLPMFKKPEDENKP